MGEKELPEQEPEVQRPESPQEAPVVHPSPEVPAKPMDRGCEPELSKEEKQSRKISMQSRQPPNESVCDEADPTG